MERALASSESCHTCEGTGWILKTLEGIDQVAPCPDCRSELRRKKLFEKARIPPRYLDRGFEDYADHHPLQKAALLKSVDYVERFPGVSRGLLFSGPCGVGKTHLSVAILKSLILEKTASGIFIDEAELLRRLQYSYGPDSPETERELLLPLMEVDLLVWDDLGTGRATDWQKETIRTVINHRYTFNRQTILSTNLPLAPATPAAAGERRTTEQTLAERIGKRLYSRILEMCEIVRLEGPDFRTEIQKAGQDFKQKQEKPSPSGIRINASLFRCPQCGSARVQVRAQAHEIRRSRTGSYLDVSLLCEGCAKDFLARFYPKTAQVEYPDV